MNEKRNFGALGFDVREIASPELIGAAKRLRYKVWQAEGAELYPSDDREIADPHDEHAIHWGVFDHEELVGTARLCIHYDITEVPDADMFAGTDLPAPIASMNRLVIVGTHRGRGFGNLLDELRIARARELGAKVIIVTPANVERRKRSLQKRGFKFMPGVLGHPSWSPSFISCACYLRLNREGGGRDE